MRRRVAAAVVMTALSLTGCFFKKKQPAPVPPATPQRPPVEMTSPKKSPPPPLEAPKVELPQPAPPVEPTVIKPKLEKVEPPAPPPTASKRKRSTTRTAAKAKEPSPPVLPGPQTPPPAAETPAPSTEATPPPPAPLPAPAAPAPLLGEVLPEEKRKEYTASIDADLGAALKVLREIEGKSLSRVQAENVSRVKAFVRQANDARSADISGAVQLARRAAILAEELSKSVQ